MSFDTDPREDQDAEMRAAFAANDKQIAELTARLAAVALAIHYPACWDVAAYPALADALSAVYAHFKCTECAPAVPDKAPATVVPTVGGGELDYCDTLKQAKKRAEELVASGEWVEYALDPDEARAALARQRPT